MSSNRNNRNQKRKQSGRGRKARNNKNQSNQNMLTNNSAAGSIWALPKRLAFPDSLRTVLRYTIPIQQVLGGGTTNSLRFTSNAYDVDSALASTSMSYFTELAAVYTRFRTLVVSYNFIVENQEAFPISLIHGIMTNSLGSTSLGQNYAGNPYMHTTIASPINGSMSTRQFYGSVSIAKLFGTNQATFDDLFTGSTTSSTLSSAATANIYVGAVSAAVPVAGWFVTGTIALDLVFSRRQDLFV